MRKLEFDKTIADFMELSVTEFNGKMCCATHDDIYSTKYHESWDWLIPVFVKAKNTIKPMPKKNGFDLSAVILVNSCKDEILSDNIEKVYENLANAIELSKRVIK